MVIKFKLMRVIQVMKMLLPVVHISGMDRLIMSQAHMSIIPLAQQGAIVWLF